MPKKITEVEKLFSLDGKDLEKVFVLIDSEELDATCKMSLQELIKAININEVEEDAEDQ